MGAGMRKLAAIAVFLMAVGLGGYAMLGGIADPRWVVGLLLVLLILVLLQSWRWRDRVRRRASHIQQRNQQVISTLQDAILRADMDGLVRAANPAWERLSGYSTADTAGQLSLQALFLDGDTQLQAFLGNTETTAAFEGPLMLRKADGRERLVQVHAAVYPAWEGGREMVVIVRDMQSVHEREQLQRARGQLLDGLLARQSLEQLVEALAASWAPLSPRSQASVLLLDEHSEQVQVVAAPGLPQAYTRALIGLRIGERVGSCGSAMSRGVPVFVADVRSDPLWAEHQSLVDEGGFSACWSMPFFNEDGRVLGSFAVYSWCCGEPSEHDLELMREFTRLAALAVQKTRLHQQQLVADQRFSAVFHQAALPMLLVSAEARVLEANPKFSSLFDFQPDATASVDVRGWLHAEDLAELAPDLGRLRRGQLNTLAREVRARLPDGSLGWFQLNVSAVRNTLGRVECYLVVGEDVSLRKAAEVSLREAAAVFDNAREGMLVTDARFRISNVNPAFVSITGLPLAEVLGRRPRAHSLAMSDRDLTRTVLRALHTEGYWQGEVYLAHNAETQVPLWVTATLIRDEQGRAERCLVMFSDLSRLRRSQEQLHQLANYDSLTGLANRTLAMLKLEQQLQSAAVRQRPLAVVYIDLDKFKSVNDNLGHACGDQVLRQAAQRLQRCCRSDDMLARIAADEFMMVLEDCPPSRVGAVAAKICQVMREVVQLEDGRQLFLTASVGYACYPDDAGNAADLVRNADTAMGSAKLAGRDCVRAYMRAMGAEEGQRFELERDMRLALEHAPEQFVLFYQPLLDLQQQNVRGVEALLRWQHPERGLVAPDQFITLAEHTGLMVPLGQWALRQACLQMRRWLDAGLGLEFVSVNLSPYQFVREDLSKQVASALTEADLDPEHLLLEITESALMTDVQQAQQTMAMLKRMGVRLALDDFGTGYSSLAYLRSFPLDKLKIDRCFLQAVPQREEDNLLLCSILDLASGLQLNVVAEGVESEEQLRFLLQHGCQMAQGFLFSRPLPSAQLESWLTPAVSQ